MRLILAVSLAEPVGSPPELAAKVEMVKVEGLVLSMNVGYDDCVPAAARDRCHGDAADKTDEEDHAHIAAPATAQRCPESVPSDREYLTHRTKASTDCSGSTIPRVSIFRERLSRGLAALSGVVLPLRDFRPRSSTGPRSESLTESVDSQFLR